MSEKCPKCGGSWSYRKDIPATRICRRCSRVEVLEK